MPATKTKAMVVDVKIESKTSFWRYNRWNRRDELQYCISMSHEGDPDSDWLVTFTGGKFVDAVEEGQVYTISCNHKRFQEYGGRCQEAVTHCKVV